MFVKTASFDSVYVHFRISPPDNTYGQQERNISSSIMYLEELVADGNSTLYDGNVTIRVDSLWGVSDRAATKRIGESRFGKKYYDHDSTRLDDPVRYSLVTPYERCKQNHRCNWGVFQLDQNTNDVKYFQRLFERGNMYGINLFLDFEDWRLGSRGFNWEGNIPPTKKGETSMPMARANDGYIRGAHFWPFDQPSLGPDIPCYLDERNQGLVLDRALLRKQITQQEALVSDIRGRIEWLEENIEWSNLGPEVRSRKDNRRNVLYEIADFQRWYDNEVTELRELNSSQCSLTDCFLHFNTTSLAMTGAIEATGEIRSTGNGTEVAVWSFNSIYIGPEVKVTIVGQRAFSLLSKTTAVINTTIEALSGTISGMLGGGSVARFDSDRYSDNARDIYICDIGRYCDNGTVTSLMKYGLMDNETFITNNVNGIGSGNVRIYPFVITTQATDYREIQVISTTAQTGQTLAGGFKLHFKTFSTPTISYEVNPDDLKSIIEKNLNLMDPANAPVASDRLTDTRAGVGEVTVSRSAQTDEEGYTWSITFSSYIGNMDQMTFTNYLQGLNAR